MGVEDLIKKLVGNKEVEIQQSREIVLELMTTLFDVTGVDADLHLALNGWIWVSDFNQAQRKQIANYCKILSENRVERDLLSIYLKKRLPSNLQEITDDQLQRIIRDQANSLLNIHAGTRGLNGSQMKSEQLQQYQTVRHYLTTPSTLSLPTAEAEALLERAERMLTDSNFKYPAYRNFDPNTVDDETQRSRRH